MNVKKMALLGGVGLASAAAGMAVPQMLSGGAANVAADPAAGEAAQGDAAAHGKPVATKKEAKKPAAKAGDHGKKDDGHGAAGHGDAKGGADIVPQDGPYFVPFGRIVANINEPLLAKYLSLEITVQTDAENEAEVKAAIELRKPILMTWLAAHLADKTTDDIRGKVGVNRLQREILDNFNSLLFTDGRERLQNILFEEFHYQ